MRVVALMLLWVAITFSRPMALGYSNATFGLVLAAGAGLLYTMSKREILMHRSTLVLFVVNTMGGFLYSIMLIIADVSSGLKVLLIVISFNLILALNVAIDQRKFLIVSKYVLRLIVVSGVITFLYFTLLEIDALGTNLVMVEFPIKDRFPMESGGIRFPLSTIFFNFTTPDGVFTRSSYLAIEPGIAPLIIVLWRLAEGEMKGIRSVFLDTVFILAMISTLSTIIPIAITIYFVGRSVFLLKKKLSLFGMVFVTILLGAGIALFFFAPVVGYYDKLVTHSISFSDRKEWYLGEEGRWSRTITVVLVIINLALAFRYLSTEKYVLAPILLLVSIVNVLAFMPLYFIAIYLFAAPKSGTTSQPRANS